MALQDYYRRFNVELRRPGLGWGELVSKIRINERVSSLDLEPTSKSKSRRSEPEWPFSQHSTKDFDVIQGFGDFGFRALGLGLRI